ncbi:MAG: DUF302 domain-containing protein [Psychromonas sp.]|nr:DUF302 domain-containing protein [Psychromonas sp.]
MQKLLFMLFVMLFVSLPTFASNGIIKIKSQFNVKTTADKFEKILNKKGMTIFKIIHHSENATKIGATLRDSQLIIFGNPKAGSSLMECEQSIGIDLPLKALIWQDSKNDVWISYNDIVYLKDRHKVKGCDKIILKVSKILENISNSATKK